MSNHDFAFRAVTGARMRAPTPSGPTRSPNRHAAEYSPVREERMTASTAGLDSARVLLVGTADWVGPFETALSARTEAPVETAETAADALDRFRTGEPDCLVTEYELADRTGIDLVRAVRDVTDTYPVVVATASGNEATASESVGAGATDYVAVGESDGDRLADPEPFDELLARTDRAVRSADRAAVRRDRARQFEAIFDDAGTATWVLDPDGSLVRANETAREMGGSDSVTGTDSAHATDTSGGSVVGDPFWTLPCWSRADGTRADVRELLGRATDGEFGNAVVTGSPGGSDTPVVDLSVHPVENERGDPVAIVVEGVDVTDRVELERDLRRSEELHRVTLNNMTDTVLITDEDGEYTYVCPNVHFIFGYGADEIREGSITDLLGEDLFDRAELAENGVLKNIECTATDRAGNEHTLLVNVREVSIQGGTLLYSCRDITKRKQREAALATLQETARDFLYTETDRAVAQRVVDDAPAVLDHDANAVYLFDADENALRPAAVSPAMERLHGPLRTVHADGETLPGHSFVAGDSLAFDDVRESDRLDRPTDLRSALAIPLGNHGVFLAGTDRVGAFDEVSRELADLLAATAEAALDRRSRESQLREQERRLQRQNDQLERLNRTNETIREIDQALVRAETREEVDYAVCEHLTGDDRFSFAWIGTVDRATDVVEPRAWAGAEQGYLDSVAFAVGAADAEPAGRTAATGAVTTVSNVAADLRAQPWRTDAISRDFLSVVSIPLVYNDLSYGVLTVYAGKRDAFDETVLTELGETIAAAISAIERKNALLAPTVTRVEFATDDQSFVLSRLAREADCTLSYRGGVQQTAAGSHVFVTVEEGSVERVERAAADLVAVEDVRQISDGGAGAILRLGLSQPFPALELADHGAVFRRASADPETTTLVVDVPESVAVRRIADLVRERFADVELRSKGTVDQASEYDVTSRLLDRLTDRQLDVIQTAYYSGFFESPRESTGEDVAEALGISSTAFYGHVRSVQRKLFATLFDELGVPVSVDDDLGG